MFTVIVTGGRNYENSARIRAVLDWLKPAAVVHGAASGADHHACEWAHEHLGGSYAFAPDWDTYGKAAGPKRNREMLEAHPRALIVAFPGGRGTSDMVTQARSLNRSVLLIDGGPQ